MVSVRTTSASASPAASSGHIKLPKRASHGSRVSSGWDPSLPSPPLSPESRAFVADTSRLFASKSPGGTSGFRVARRTWDDWTSRMSPSALSLQLSRLFRRTLTPLPMRRITPSDAVADFQALKGVLADPSSYLDHETQPRYPGAYRRPFDPADRVGNPLYYNIIKRRQPFVGGTASNFCQLPARVRSSCFGMPSPHDAWMGTGMTSQVSDRRRASMLRGLPGIVQRTLPPDGDVTSAELAEAVYRRMRLPSQFPPYTMPVLLSLLRELAGTPPSKKWAVLDPCAGWTDREVGIRACDSIVSHYTAIDPNAALIPGQRRAAATFPSGVNVHHICKPAEDVTDADFGPHADLQYDLVFTSPPYFLKERYAQADTQSAVRYHRPQDSVSDNLKNWREGFLFPMLRKAWKRLKPGGFLAINIGDFSLPPDPVTGKRARVSICDSMNRFIAEELGGAYRGAIGLAMESRPSRDYGTTCEPIWIFERRPYSR